MNKIAMVRLMVDVADTLDGMGLTKEADFITDVMTKIADSYGHDFLGARTEEDGGDGPDDFMRFMDHQKMKNRREMDRQRKLDDNLEVEDEDEELLEHRAEVE